MRLDTEKEERMKDKQQGRERNSTMTTGCGKI